MLVPAPNPSATTLAAILAAAILAAQASGSPDPAYDLLQRNDRATYDDPLQPPAGITHGFVDGRLAVRHGRTTGMRAWAVRREHRLEPR
jgi:hypothetical protein